MEAVTFALIGFIFVCIALPQLVRNRTQFYLAVVLVAAVIFLESLLLLSDPTGTFAKILRVTVGFANFIGYVSLIMATGGLSLRQLTGEVSHAIDSMRHPEHEKSVVVPLTSQRPGSATTKRPRVEDESRAVFHIGEETAGDSTVLLPPTPAPRRAPAGPIPLAEDEHGIDQPPG